MNDPTYITCQACRFNRDGQCRRHAPRPIYMGQQWDQNLNSYSPPSPNIVYWPPAVAGCGEGEPSAQ